MRVNIWECNKAYVCNNEIIIDTEKSSVDVKGMMMFMLKEQ